MTCIVGLVTDTGEIVFGADSLVTDGSGQKATLSDKKIFVKNNLIFGYCGHVRYGQLVKHRFTPPSPGRNRDTENFIYTKFVPELQRFFTQDCSLPQLQEFSLVVGINRRMFVIEEDYSVIESPSRYVAAGVGAPYALGALFATHKSQKNEIQRLTLALEAASYYDNSTAKPFHFERLSPPSKRRTSRGR